MTDQYFVLDSNNVSIQSTMFYGYMVDGDNIITCADPLMDSGINAGRLGCYVYISASANDITITQDCSGSYGLYFYENDGYFAISNSFLFLVEHLNGRLSINKDVLYSFLAADLSNLAYRKTLVNEIQCLEKDEYFVVDKVTQKLEIKHLRKDTTLYDVESEETIKLLDEWHEKWIYFIRKLFEGSKPIDVDLTGGIDSRLVFSLFVNSKIALDHVNVISYRDGSWTHKEDYQIASQIAEKYSFSLNAEHKEVVPFAFDEFMNETLYSYTGCHKQWIFNPGKNIMTRYRFTGASGEKIRGYWKWSRKQFIDHEKSKLHKIYGEESRRDESIDRVFDDSFNYLRQKYGISEREENIEGCYLWNDVADGKHFGRNAEYFYKCNEIRLQPLTDPMLDKIKLIEDRENKDLIAALIYERYLPEVLDIPFDSGHVISKEAIEKARELNKKHPYKGTTYEQLSYKEKSTKKVENLEKQYYMKDGNEFVKHCFFSSKVKKLFSDIKDDELYYSTGVHAIDGEWFPLGNAEILLFVAYIMDKTTESNFYEFLQNVWEPDILIPYEIVDRLGNNNKEIVSIRQRDNCIMALYSKWVNNPDAITKYLYKKEFNKIGIYGAGRLGIDLIKYLKTNTRNTIAFVMDRKTNIYIEDVKILDADADIPDCDVIITTVAGMESEIESFLKQRTSIPIVALNDIVSRN